MASVSELPTPITDYFGAYLVGTSAPYTLYVPLRDSGTYHNIGPYSGGSIVNVNGEYQQVWDADSKLDKITTTGAYRLYGANASGNEWNPTLRQVPQTTNSAYKYQPVMYDITSGAYVNNGLIRISETPIENYHTASKAYVDNRYRLYRHDINFIVNDSGDSYNCYFTLYNTQASAMNNGTLHTDGYIAVSGVVDRADGRQYPIFYGAVNPGTSYVLLTYYDPEEKQMVAVNLDAATFDTYDTVSRVF